METTFYLRQLIFPVLISIPYFLIILVGLGLSFFRFKKYKKTSILSIIALLIFAFIRIVAVFQPIFNIWMIDSKMDPDTFGYMLGGINAVTSILGTIALAFLVNAVWSNRRKKDQ